VVGKLILPRASAYACAFFKSKSALSQGLNPEDTN